MAEWGRKEYQSWPSRKPVWTLGAFAVTLLLIAGVVVWQYARQWSFAEREYLRSYILSDTLGRLAGGPGAGGNVSSTTKSGCPRCLAFGHLGYHEPQPSVWRVAHP